MMYIKDHPKDEILIIVDEPKTFFLNFKLKFFTEKLEVHIHKMT